MARIFITGSADGLGLLAAKELIGLGHKVVLHARNTERAKELSGKVPNAEDILIADLSSMDETKALAAKANSLEPFDAIIHNAGIYHVPTTSVSSDGLSLFFAVNSIAPYILTCLIRTPKRLIYLSSNMHLQGNAKLDNLSTGRSSDITYSDTKLHDLILSLAVARKWKDTYTNAVDPGWVATKMGGSGAPDSLEKGYETQVWLAVSEEPEAKVSGQLFHHKRTVKFLQAAKDRTVQEKFLAECEKITGVRLQETNSNNVGKEHSSCSV